MDVLLTWVGARDPGWDNPRTRARRSGQEPGPILSLLQSRPFDVVYLLYNIPADTDNFSQPDHSGFDRRLAARDSAGAGWVPPPQRPPKRDQLRSGMLYCPVHYSVGASLHGEEETPGTRCRRAGSWTSQ
jgi:hypothetical protein